MFNPFNPSSGAPSKALPPRPAVPAWQQKIQEQAAKIAAQEQAVCSATQEQPEAVPIFNKTEDSIVTEPTTMTAPITAPMTMTAPVPAEPDEATADDLPAKAGIIDYRSGEGLPPVMSESQAQQTAERLNGLNFAITLPVVHREPLLAKDGTPRLSKTGSQMMRKVRVPTNMNVIASGDENLTWISDPTYALQLIVEQMIFRVQGHMDAQSLSIKEGWTFDAAWLSKHFGTSNLAEAIESELRPWAATKVSTLSAAAQQAMCSNITDAEEIVRLYEIVIEEAESYLSKVTKGASSKAKIAEHLAPLTKCVSKYEAWMRKLDKSRAEGKPDPKPLVIKSLAGETVRGIRAIAGVLLTIDAKRQSIAAKFAAGTYPSHFTAEDAAEYIAQTPEYSIAIQTVACWLQQIATNMQAAEQRRLQKYSDGSAADAIVDDFDFVKKRA